MSETTDLSIGQVADRTGLSVHALRFYEREGVMVNPVRRDAAGRRVYHAADVDWIGLCVKLRSTGMPLATIREYADLVRGGLGNEEQRLEILRAHQAYVESQLAELNDCLKRITYKVNVYEDRLAQDSTDAMWNPRPSC